MNAHTHVIASAIATTPGASYAAALLAATREAEQAWKPFADKRMALERALDEIGMCGEADALDTACSRIADRIAEIGDEIDEVMAAICRKHGIEVDDAQDGEEPYPQPDIAAIMPWGEKSRRERASRPIDSWQTSLFGVRS